MDPNQYVSPLDTNVAGDVDASTAPLSEYTLDTPPQQSQPQQGSPNLLQQAGTYLTTPRDGSQMENKGWMADASRALSGFLTAQGISFEDWIDNTFQGDKFTREQLEQRVAEARAKDKETFTSSLVPGVKDPEVNSLGERLAYEGGNMVAGAYLKANEGVLEAGDYLGDVGAGLLDTVGVIERDETDLPWSDAYEAADYDLGQLKGNLTPLGSMGKEILATVINMKRLASGGVGIGKGQSIGSRLSSEAFRGLIVDFLQNPGEGNLSNLVNDKVLANKLSAALAHQDEDNDLIRRLKNSIEGGTIGLAVDGLTELYTALRAGTTAVKKGMSAKKAADKVLEKINDPSPRSTGFEARQAENSANSARPPSDAKPEGKPGKFDDYERVSQTYKADINDAAVNYGKPGREPGSGTSAVDEVDVQSLRTADQLREFIKGKLPEVDIDTIAKRLRKQGDEYVMDTYKALARYADSKATDALEELVFTNTQGIKGVDAGGAVVLRALVDSVTERISVLSQNLLEVQALGGDFKTQAIQILDRAEALVTMQKEAKQFSSANLKNWGQTPINLPKAVDADKESIEEIFGKWRNAFETGDVIENLETRQQFAEFAMGLAANGGDPVHTINFFQALAKVGIENITSTYINSLLSGVLTTVRNVTGTAFATLERPLAMSVGYAIQGNAKGARRALSAYDSFLQTTWESLAVGWKAGKKGESIASGANRFSYTDRAIETERLLANLARTADTPAKKWAAGVLQRYHDLVQSPWFQWPGKALTGQDDFFKSMSARMDARLQAAEEADMIVDAMGAKPKGDELKKIRDKLYRQIVDEKIGPDGEILDAEMIRGAEDVTFQRDLEGTMARVDDAIKGLPGSQLFIPFVKTPHNVGVYGAQHVPGIARFTREYQQVMKYGTPREQAIYKGREALGYLLVTSVFGLKAGGLITGNGPPPGTKEREMWLRTHQPMSIRVGDKWVSYKALPGISLIAAVLSDGWDIIGNIPNKEATYIFANAAYAIAASVTSQAYFAGLSDLGAALDPKQWSPQGIWYGAGDVVNNALFGGASLRRNFNNLISEGMYEWKNDLHRIAGTLSGGIVGAKIPVPDVLTGKTMSSVYDNPWNAVNPFTVKGTEVSPLVEKLSALDFPISNKMFTNVDGVKLNAEEQRLVRLGMYDNGNFPKALNTLLRPNSRFWKNYQKWREDVQSGVAAPREEYRWYVDLSKIVTTYRGLGRRALVSGQSDVSKAFLERRAAEQAKAAPGSAGADVERIRTIGQF